MSERGADPSLEKQVEERLARLTREEKVALCAGVDLWHTGGVPRLGIAPVKVTDGPNGARGAHFAGGPTSACFPCGSALGATWSPELVEQVGAALAEEARSKGAQVLLAPTVNLHRSPQAGRNFECYSEDPHLTARLAVAFVRGVQSRGVGSCIKHFVCNESEFERHTMSSEVDERTLREVYLHPFEAAVEEARPWAVMAAYNKLNGAWCSESPWLLGELLKEEWGYDGVVMSDWFGSHSTAPAANAGLDLEMPGPARHYDEKLLDAVRAGEVSDAVLDEHARRLLRLWLRAGAPEDAPEDERAEDRPAHRALARRAAAEAMVLLRNQDGALPLEATRLRSLAVVGPNADAAVIQGGGSARVSPHRAITPLEGIRERCGDGLEVLHEPGCTRHRTLPLLDASHLAPASGEESGERLRVEYFDSPDLSGAPVATRTASRLHFTWLGEVVPGIDPRRFSARVSAALVARETGTYALSLVSAGRSRLFLDGRELIDNWTHQERGEAFFGLGSTEVEARVPLRAGERHALAVEYGVDGGPGAGGLRAGLLPPFPADAMERAAAAAGRADAAIVVVGLDPDWETEGRDRADLSLPGRQAELVERVAGANARTIVVVNAGAPVEMEWAERVAAVVQAWYPGQEWGHALADLLFGDASPCGKLPTTFPRRLEDGPSHPFYPGAEGRVAYGEGALVGYRHYDARGIEPRFPFGHGLTYTRFEIEEVAPDANEIVSGEALELTVSVRNAGQRAGADVVQLYVRGPGARADERLVAFAKPALAPGERRALRLRVEPRALASWDGSGFRVARGDYELLAGLSSRDLRARASFRVETS